MAEAELTPKTPMIPDIYGAGLRTRSRNWCCVPRRERFKSAIEPAAEAPSRW